MERTLDYTFTRDEKQLRQYYRLRKIIYAKDLKFQLKTLSDAYDEVSDVLVVRNRNRCVGGVRLTIAAQNQDMVLPLEEVNFRLHDLFPELHLHSTVYAELSRLILLPEYRDGNITEKIYRRIYVKCRQHGVKYLFAITPRVQARRYVLDAKRMGFSATIADIPIPPAQREKYSGLADCLVIMEQAKKVHLPKEDSLQQPEILTFGEFRFPL